MQLIMYFASVTSTPSSDEIGVLRVIPVFLRAPGSINLQLHLHGLSFVTFVGTSYTPAEDHIGLGLPVIEWKV